VRILSVSVSDLVVYIESFAILFIQLVTWLTSLTTTGVALKILSYTCDIYLLFDEDLIFIFPNFPMEAVIGTNDIYLPVQLLQETFSCSWVTLSFCFPTKLDFLCSRTKQLR